MLLASRFAVTYLVHITFFISCYPSFEPPANGAQFKVTCKTVLFFSCKFSEHFKGYNTSNIYSHTALLYLEVTREPHHPF